MLAIKPRGSEFESAEPMLKPETRYFLLAMLGQGSQRLADLRGSLVGQPSLIMKHSMWALGTELRFSAGTVCAPNYRANCKPNSHVLIVMRLFNATQHSTMYKVIF